ncbi:hypothetical protein B0H14DRAFT_3431630 [Mycena olivaceomarginata]|nr:hypothetical protein B0H14DRAFT_3431630 [Mycena olivaceomarginata]
MDNDSVFSKSEWIGQHKVWASAPRKLRKLATEFLIPQQLEHDLLPSPYLSIAKMVEFTPSPSKCDRRSPPARTVLQHGSSRYYRPGLDASHVSGAVTHLPLWILMYWAAVDDAEEESDAPVVLGRGQRRKIVARRYQGPAWEKH